MTDLIIIGAGPAGLTAAIYAMRYGLSVLVLDKGLYGGQLVTTNEVENYPAIQKISGPELANQIYEQAQAQGAQVKFEQVTHVHLGEPVKTVVTDGGKYLARAVIAANGAYRRRLGCPGEQEFTGRGVSYCATCDGAFFKGQSVAVVGGGNTALEDVLFLSNICERVFVIHRRDEFRAQTVLQQAVLQKENVTLLYSHTVQAIKGGQRVECIQLQNLKNNDITTVEVNAVFVAIGLQPDNGVYEGQLPMDQGGYLLVDETCVTPIAGVFAAGDNRQKPLRQIITAASDGAVAAFQAANYLNVTGVGE